MCHAQPSGGPMPAAVVDLQVGADATGLRWFPAGQAAPIVLVIPDYFGPGAFYVQVADRLRRAGFAAALVDPFTHLPGVAAGDHAAAIERLRKLGDDAALRRLEAALGWAKRGSSGRVGVVGFCAGGTWTMCLATRADVAGVAFYGFPDGHPIGDERRRPLEFLHTLRSPLLAQWGSADHAVGMDVISAFRSAAPPAVRTVVHAGAGHGFLGALVQEDTEPASVAMAAWEETLTFLGVHLTNRVTA